MVEIMKLSSLVCALLVLTCGSTLIDATSKAYATTTTYHRYVYNDSQCQGSACDGTSWAKAWKQIPVDSNGRPVLSRDTTYWFGAGNYGIHDIIKPADGAKYIIYKKATTSEHGPSNEGWDEPIGDGQAIFTRLYFRAQYFIFDGTSGSGTSGHGFKVFRTGDNQMLTQIEANDVTIKHVEITNETVIFMACGTGIYAVSGNYNITFQYNYIHDVQDPITTRGCNTILAEHNYIARNNSEPTAHSEAWSDQGSNNVSIRYNIFEDIEGTGYIVVLDGGAGVRTSDNWQIYGNVFFYSEGNPSNRIGISNGVICCINNQNCTNWKIYNNTIANITSEWSARIQFVAQGINNEVKNNIWFCNKGVSCKNAIHVNVNIADYNWYSYSIAHTRETNEQISNVNPFQNIGAKNYRLRLRTGSGINLGPPYNVDMDGRVRGGIWDRGAFQFGDSALTPPPNFRLSQ